MTAMGPATLGVGLAAPAPLSGRRPGGFVVTSPPGERSWSWARPFPFPVGAVPLGAGVPGRAGRRVPDVAQLVPVVTATAPGLLGSLSATT
ncbi:hypothetical protein [Streptomyces humi]|uniref:hypothetical protein n=1 Tax=Streptomyces humi TaxID=1428620 RepID=UPI00062891BA|nr:hypothetical protein [Streptomyces humi]